MNTEDKLKTNDFTKALAECIHQAQGSIVDPMAHAEIWKDALLKFAKGEEPVSEDLEEAAKTYAKKESHGYEPCNIVETFKAGAKYQRQQNLKYGYITALQGEKQFARNILEMIANGWHIEAIRTACNDKIREDEQ